MKLTYEQALNNFSEKFHASKAKTLAGRGLIPGGFSRRTFNYGPHAVFVEKGDGQYIQTIEGHRLLDLNNNFSTNVVGHNHPDIIKAITDMMDKGFSFGNPTDHELELASLLSDRIESVEQVKFFCSASEACLGAIRIARSYTGKTKIAKFEGGYHGFADDLAISTHPSPSNFPGPDNNPRSLPDSDGIPSYKVDNVVTLVQNDFKACEKILRSHSHDTACVIMELQSGAGGIVSLDKTFVAKIRELTSELGIVLIVDETMSLRASTGGLQKLYEVKPDLTVMGKMIGGGLPIGAIGGSREVFSVVEANQVMVSGTHHGHPMACATGIACLNVMDDAAFDKINGMAERIKSELNSWAKASGIPFIVYGSFSILGYALTRELGQEITTHRDYWHKIDEDKMSIYAMEMATRGYYPVHRGQIGLMLPMTDEDITGYIETTKDIVNAIYNH
ncbi:aspartate aminotransferase family protein [Vreelandella nigrificans]|uniref:Glutamate-1-semialdehyde 2,1-aminomutase n=1 Tax=Vreelandella nigrificans TaxID=2042704 RepID=A0A2A4HSC6_9GAMM|nr:aminotransferase class III-fold pyridoxal phosphate-dependent enzyme [Halomonas nigrificans]PCF96983.1 glutamate-1-semialdehyde 2,1-aminomutase [Halomonas nigrificans]